MKLLFDTNILIYHFNNQLTESGTALYSLSVVMRKIFPRFRI